MPNEPTQLVPRPNQHRPVFWLTFCLLLPAFFLTEHSATISLADAYTGTADQMEMDAAGGNVIRRIVFLGLAGWGALMLLLPSERRLRMSGGIGLCILGFAGWAFLSIFWSVDSSMTIRRCLAMGCLLTAALGIARQLSTQELLRLGWLIPLTTLFVGVAAELALGTFHPHTGSYRFAGTLHPNTQGMYLASLCLAAFCWCRESGWRQLGPLSLLLIGFSFLVLTKSRTSAAGFLVAVTLLLTLRTRSSVKWMTGFASAWVVAVAALTVLLSGIDVKQELTELALLGRQEQAESLTGRLPIWTELQTSVEQRPLTGFGYDTFWTPDRIETVSSTLHWAIHEAHSAYIDTLLSVGLIGLLILLTGVVVGIRAASRRYLAEGEPLYGFLFGLFVFGLINGFTESGMTMPMFVPFLCVCGLASLATRRCEVAAPAEPAWQLQPRFSEGGWQGPSPTTIG